MIKKMHIQYIFLPELLQKWVFHPVFCRFYHKNGIL